MTEHEDKILAVNIFYKVAFLYFCFIKFYFLDNLFIIPKDLVYDLIEQKPAKVVLDIISDLGGIMGLCIGASLMSFVELIDFALNCLFIYCGFKEKRVENKEEGLAEKSDREITLSERRLVKLEDLLSVCINKNAWLEAELSATREQVRKLLNESED
jgi:hypothetical protein